MRRARVGCSGRTPLQHLTSDFGRVFDAARGCMTLEEQRAFYSIVAARVARETARVLKFEEPAW